MNTQVIQRGGTKIAVMTSEKPIMIDEASALDTMMSCHYETDTRLVAIEKSVFSEDFFKLSTGVAGAILQKFVTYQFRVAIFGDFSHYTSKPLKDFIYESNKGKLVGFVSTQAQAVERLLHA